MTPKSPLPIIRRRPLFPGAAHSAGANKTNALLRTQFVSSKRKNARNGIHRNGHANQHSSKQNRPGKKN